MSAIKKLRQMTNWVDNQSEYINEQLKSIPIIEQVYDYALKNNLDFIDDDFLWGECTEQERLDFKAFLNKINK